MSIVGHHNTTELCCLSCGPQMTAVATILVVREGKKVMVATHVHSKNDVVTLTKTFVT